jgi:HEAT repeat protein
MHALLKTQPRGYWLDLAGQLLRAIILLIPTGLLLGAAARTTGQVQLMLLLGVAFQALVVGMTLISSWGRQQPLAPSIITLYLIGLGWLWWGVGSFDDWYMHLARSILLVVPILAFGLGTLTDSGAPAIRRARLLAQRLAARKDWPSDLAACQSLPEVKAFREALHIDATPALALLEHKRPEVRVAALGALEFRKDWRPGQAEYVLRVAQIAPEPPVRAAAVGALGNLEDRLVVEALANFLRDQSWEVRQAATEALLWDTERRWPWIRYAVRRTLADPLLANDGPLRHNGNLLSPEAVNDLNSWATEKGLLASRAALTLGAHYGRALGERPDDTLLPTLRHQLADSHTPPVLRIELARLLWNSRELDRGLLLQLLDSSNPAPLRLIAVEALLGEDRDQPGSAEAMGALRDLARLPNREIALATAELVQRRLGVDVGLRPGEPLPLLHSRQAAEVTRRVMMWAARDEVAENVMDSQPLVER